MQANKTALALAALAFASGAYAQSTSTSMDMGGGMTHVDTMGPNGAMSSSNCMNLGGGMATCNTMDMSPRHGIAHEASDDAAGDSYRASRVPQYDLNADLMAMRNQNAAMELDIAQLREEAAALKSQSLQRWPVAGRQISAATDTVSVPLPIPPISLVLITPNLRRIKDNIQLMFSHGASPSEIDSYVESEGVRAESLRGIELTKGASKYSSNVSKDDDTQYTVKYLGHVLYIVGSSKMSIQEIRAWFEGAWDIDPWIAYTTSTSKTDYYYNIKSEKVYSDRIEIWVKADHSKDLATKARESKLLYEIRCENQTIRELQSAEYDARGKLVSSSDRSDKLVRVIPETVGSALYDEICKLDT